MNKLIISIFFILAILTATSCNSVDLSGIASSSDVDKRFTESISLPEKANLPIPENDFSFIVITDTHIEHQSNTNLDILRNKLLPQDKFILTCGDITQCGSMEDFQAFRNYLDQTKLPYYTAIGNHDLYYDGWSNYKQTLGKSCYSFTAGPAKIISIDSANGTIGRKQKDWLKQVLQSKTEPLCLVFTHFEFFSPGDGSVQQYTDTEEVYYLMHLFETYHVNYVFMGHSHQYNYNQVANVNYLNLADLADDGKSKEFIRVYINGANVSYQRIEL